MIQVQDIWELSSRSSLNDKKDVISSMAFKPDGSKLILSCGKRLLVVDAYKGVVVQSLKGHKDRITSVTYSFDGSHFASGGSDKRTIIWKDEDGKGILKFSHESSVQVVTFNPVRERLLLASCSNVDFGFWSPTSPSVQKIRVSSKILCASWSHDGQNLAIGMTSGIVSIRDNEGAEIANIQRSAPVWALSWVYYCPNDSPTIESNDDNIIVIGSWDKTLSFYERNGGKAANDRSIDFYPYSIIPYGNTCEYFLLCGSDNKIIIGKGDGGAFKEIVQLQKCCWNLASTSSRKAFACSDKEGNCSLKAFQLDVVYDTYDDRFVYRDNLSDAVIQHKHTAQKQRIKGRNFIENLVLYRNRLAICTEVGIVIYEIPQTNSKSGLQYRKKETVKFDKSHSFIQVFTSNVLMSSHQCNLHLFNFKGERIRTWKLPGRITSSRVIGGPDSSEGIFIGLESGEIYLIHTDNSYPIEYLEHSSGIKDMFLSCKRKFLAFIDDEKHLVIYDMEKKSTVLTINEPSTGVQFHSDKEDVFSLTTKSGAFVRSMDNIIQTYPSKGVTLCLFGNYLLSLHMNKIHSTDISFNHTTIKLIEEKKITMANKMITNRTSQAMLGKLIYSSTQNGSKNISLNFLERLDDCKLLNSIKSSRQILKHQKRKLHSNQNFNVYIDVFNDIYSGDFEMAIKRLIKTGDHATAIDILVSMWKWEEAKVLVSKSGNKMELQNILRKEADWLAALGDWEKAAEIYVSCRDFISAVETIGDFKGENWDQVLIEIVRNVKKEQVDVLTLACDIFSSEHLDMYLKEIYKKMEDYSNLMELSMKNQNWLEVTEIINFHKDKIEKSLFVPYAEWLVEQERFEDAFAYYQEAGKTEKSENFLLQLANNAIAEERFIQASRFFWVLWTKFRSEKSVKSDVLVGLKSYNYLELFQLFYSYKIIHEFCTEPFTNVDAETIIQVGSMIMRKMTLNQAPPRGISIANVLFAVSKQARKLGAFQTAKTAYKMLRRLKVDQETLERLDVDIMTIQAIPEDENSEILPVCYRCGNPNNYLLPFHDQYASSKLENFDVCEHCLHPNIRCFLNFDILPLVEFEPTLPYEETLSLIFESPSCISDGIVSSHDLFVEAINNILETTGESNYASVKADENVLRQISREDVFILYRRDTAGSKIPVQFFKNIIPELGIAVCQKCNNFFHEEDFEYFSLKEGTCPVCHEVVDTDYGHI